MPMKSVMGDQTKTVSAREDLLTDAVVSGAANPTHTPQRAAQLYIQTTSNNPWVWAKGAWVEKTWGAV